MAKKIFNLAVKVGSYTKDGQEKGQYINVGSEVQNDDGSTFIIMNRTFNPAGVPNPGNKDSVIISKYPVQQNNPFS